MDLQLIYNENIKPFDLTSLVKFMFYKKFIVFSFKCYRK